VKLEENMVIAIETWYPTKGYPQEGARFEETMVVKKEGCEILTKWPGKEITEAWV
jgi:Xaa-Pro aminopeptidase